MANFAVTNKEALDSLNYVLSGPSDIGNEFEGVNYTFFEYCSGDRIPPYMSPTLPSPPPPTDTYIETDTYAVVNVTEPTQKITVSAQCRPFVGWTITTGPTDFRVYIAVNRYKAPNILYYPTNLNEYSVSFTNYTPSDPNEDDLGQRIFLTLIDQPGEIGEFYYWLEFYVEVLSGDFQLDYIGAETRSISASLVKP